MQHWAQMGLPNELLSTVDFFMKVVQCLTPFFLLPLTGKLSKLRYKLWTQQFGQHYLFQRVETNYYRS